MAKTVSLFIVFLALYGTLIIPFTTYLNNKPFAERLGYVPSATALKIVAADQKELAGALLVLKVLMYFGGLTDKSENQVALPPDLAGM